MKILNSPSISKNTKVFFTTFSRYEKGVRLPTNGMVEPMLYYFLPKVKTFVMLDQPHPVSDTINPFVEIYHEGKLQNKFRIPAIMYLPVYLLCRIEKGITRISYKMRDFISVLIVGLSVKEKFDLFVGLEGINVLAGLVLRSFGKVKIVVYYVSDYSPNRFRMYGRKLLNNVYLWLDRFCVVHADFTWDVSQAMIEGRIMAGLNPRDKVKVVHVPNGLFPEQIKSLPIKERNNNYLVYMGILTPDMGPALAVKAVAQVLRQFPEIKLHIIGGPETDVNILKKLALKLGIVDSIIFYGFIPDNNKMADIVRRCYIGLAPYRSYKESIRWYGDAGKIRQYMASGLPVVTTQVPPLGRYVVERGAGIMTKDTVSDFSRGIIKLLNNRKLYAGASIAAEKLGKSNTWKNTYDNALKQMAKRKD